jgi:hypothetical protein
MQGHVVFNKAEPMYLEAAIKASFPKTMRIRVEIANKVSLAFDGCPSP